MQHVFAFSIHGRACSSVWKHRLQSGGVLCSLTLSLASEALHRNITPRRRFEIPFHSGPLHAYRTGADAAPRAGGTSCATCKPGEAYGEVSSLHVIVELSVSLKSRCVETDYTLLRAKFMLSCPPRTDIKCVH
jgi:hypothetical protein